MNYEEINPLELPHLLIAKRYSFPNISAVYFLFSAENELLYIGKTNSLAIRWAKHHILKKIDKSANHRIAYFQIEVDKLPDAETFFILKYQPSLNWGVPRTARKPKSEPVKCNIKVNIKEIAISKGFDTGYKLQKVTGVQPNLAYKWFDNDLQSISMKSLNRLCIALNCQPSDLLVFTAEEMTA